MKYENLATNDQLEKLSAKLSSNGFLPIILNNKSEALEKIKELIPAGASVMNGSSVTLKEIGFIDFLKSGSHNWNNIHANILAEKDEEKQNQLRKHSVLSDYYLGSAHAITESGEILIASNTGSQLPHLVYTSQNIILVIGSNKITQDIADAFNRINEYVVSLEDERMKSVYGFGTTYAKTLILHKENPMFKRQIHIILVKEKLGY